MRLRVALVALLLSGISLSAQRIPGVGRFVIPPPSGGACTTTISSGSNLNTAINNVTAGGTLCLESGTYTTGITITTTKASQTTVRSLSGVGAVFPQLTITGAQKITFDHLTVSGLTITNNNSIQDITVSNSVQTEGDQDAYWEISCRDWSGAKNIVFDGNTHKNTFDWFDNQSNHDGRLTFTGGSGLSGDRANCGGIVVKNSSFDGVNDTYCSDGVFFQAGNVHIGPNNHFTNMVQGDCPQEAHVDSIQCYDCEGGIVIEGNYFDSSSVAIGWYDSYDGANALGFEISNNVFEGSGHQFVTINGFDDLLFEHNTFNAVDIGFGQKAGETPPNSNITMRNNLYLSGSSLGGANGNCCLGTGSTRSNELTFAGMSINGSYPTCTSCVVGVPTFIGSPRNFANWVNWALSGGSTGENGAHDGTDIGTLCFGACP